ncbi:MAG: hypothetical protein NVS3B26_30920 [Mycobacteriales bacterium]
MTVAIESVTVEIDAPQQLVWDVLVDFARYGDWNPYTVRVEATLSLGADVVLTLPTPGRPGETMTTTETMRVIDPPRHLQYDTADRLAGILAVRDQWVADLGGDRSSYRTADVFSGPHAQRAFDLQGAWVKAGFDAVAQALKERAEALHRASSYR